MLIEPGFQTFVTRDPSTSQLAALLNNPEVNRIFAADVPFIAGGEVQIFSGPDAVPPDLLSSVTVIADSRSQNYPTQFTDGIDL